MSILNILVLHITELSHRTKLASSQGKINIVIIFFLSMHDIKIKIKSICKLFELTEIITDMIGNYTILPFC